jgi:putative hydrolase of the HAD superfamily
MPVRCTVARTIRPRSARSTNVAIAKATPSETAALNHGLCQSVSAMRGSGARMAAHSTPRAVLLDALGTLISFEPPAPRLRLALRERLGVDVGAEVAEAAIRAEIAYYRAHLHEGRDAAALADLRARCAEAMRPALGLDAPLEVLTRALLDALRFFAYPDAAPALAALRAAGIRTVVVSNWDASLHERLRETGLAELVDGALASAEVGSAKPDGAIFAAALELARTRDAWHVGDTPEADVEGALAAGLRPVLIARDGPPPPLPGVPVIESLAGLIPLVVPR